MEKYTKIYAEVLEESAKEQFDEAMSQDFVVSGALMPDAHTGYSLPIGAVVACRNYVVPAYVGFDIGCGMSAQILRGVSKQDVIANADEIFKNIYKRVPVGFNRFKPGKELFDKLPKDLDMRPRTAVVSDLEELGLQQLGTLGGGNHFIEVGVDEHDSVWIVVHSGSRGFGHKVASHYMKIANTDVRAFAKEFDDKNADLLKYAPDKYEFQKDRFISKKVSKATAKDGHKGFAADSEIGRNYMMDALFAQQFALHNREQMIESTIRAIDDACNTNITHGMELINRNHNHVVTREIDGEKLYIHRKGATHAEKDMWGVIPGNMRDGSFVVKGKGNPDSLFSSSHGAGRVLGRKAAQRELKMNDFKSQMTDVKALVTKDTLDESPSAYKNIFEVMRLQEDLVEVQYHIKPLINIKG